MSRNIKEAFPLTLHLGYAPDLEDGFMLMKDFIYIMRDGRQITSPELMETDLASIPRACRFLLKGHGKYTYGAIPHDLLYSSQGVFMDQDGKVHRLSRKECDDVLYDACRDAGTSRWKTWTIYSGVRMGGWVAWNNYKKKEK